MKKLILIRHGETTKDKSDEKRVLTSNGIARSKELAQELSSHIENTNKTVIIHTGKLRSIETAVLVAHNNDITNIEQLNFRIKHLGILSNQLNSAKDASESLVECYLKLHKQFLEIENKKDYITRIEKELEKVFQIYDLVIAVSHEVSMEVFIEYSVKYDLIIKTFGTTTNYSDYAVLKQK